MKPELWTLVRKDDQAKLIERAAAEGSMKLRMIHAVGEALGLPEPEGGIILFIDTESEGTSHLTIVKRFRKTFFQLDVVLFGEPMSPERIERERDKGIDLFIAIPAEENDFLARISHLAGMRAVKSQAGIIGRSRPLCEMVEVVAQVAPTEVTVLIAGESGSGKEVTAKAIHLMSRRREKPFDAINCGALAEGVLESELFGHEKGSFTGAVTKRIGLFERANGGTLFLDEVGEMSLNMQVRLLRVLETGEFLRVGGTERVHTDVRLIAATNRELESAVDRKEFRKDLYYRLKVVQIRIPPLRARTEDITILANYFMQRAALKHSKSVRSIEPAGLELLERYPWPGNVRELSNLIDNLVVLGRESTIRASEIEARLQERMTNESLPDLPIHVMKSREDVERELILNSLLSLHNDVREILRLLGGSEHGPFARRVDLRDSSRIEPRDLHSLEREAVRRALAANNGNRKRTAKQLGISERTLYRRLKEYGLG